jgi:hypothetical protein
VKRGKAKSRNQRVSAENQFRVYYRMELRRELQLAQKHRWMPGFLFRWKHGTPESRAIDRIADDFRRSLERRA